MRRLFHQDPAPQALRTLPPRVLLQRPSLAAPWLRIEQVVGLPSAHFRQLYLATLVSLLNHVQLLQFPIRDDHPGDVPFVDSALARAARALSLARGHLLPPGRATEDAKDHHHVWRYGIFTAELLRGMEQVALGQVIQQWGWCNRRQRWDPSARPLHVRWRAGWYAAVEVLPPPSAAACLPLAESIIPHYGLAWISSDSEAYAAWVHALCGQPGQPKHTEVPANTLSPTTAGGVTTLTGAVADPSPSVDTPFRPALDALGGRKLGRAFWAWLTRSMADGSLTIDDTDSLLFRVADVAIALRTPQTFQRYAAQTGADWRVVQQGFLKLQMHRRAGESNFSELEVDHGRRYPVVIVTLSPGVLPIGMTHG